MIYLPPTIEPTTRETVVHEFNHVIIEDKTSGNCPRWLNEGVALFMVESIMNVSYELGEDYLNLNEHYTMAELDDFNNIRYIPLAYRQSLFIVRYVVDIHGEEKLLQILSDLNCREPSLPKIMEDRLGMDYKTFEQKAYEWEVEKE